MFIEKAQSILKKYNIDVLYSEKNLTWALNWDHSVEYVKAVADALEKADELGKAAVLQTLDDIADVLNRGQKFRGIEQ